MDMKKIISSIMLSLILISSVFAQNNTENKRPEWTFDFGKQVSDFAKGIGKAFSDIPDSVAKAVSDFVHSILCAFRIGGCS
jgi:hypothetical protein